MSKHLPTLRFEAGGWEAQAQMQDGSMATLCESGLMIERDGLYAWWPVEMLADAILQRLASQGEEVDRA